MAQCTATACSQHKPLKGTRWSNWIESGEITV
jgi:hypothetical protein